MMRNKITEKQKPKVSLSKQLLLYLLDTADYLARANERIYLLSPVYSSYPKRERQHFLEYQRLRSLERRKLVKLKRIGGELFYRISDDGVREGLKTRVISCNKRLPQEETCLIAFDIPEDIRNVRLALRSFLKKAGFRKVQQSLWESDMDVIADMEKLFKLLGIGKYTAVYKTKA
ncbi:MAG: hypothetical protein ABH826_05385 [Patescibacteria group bacterium]|nr:hypothetical protein [Patescibacteria group bacterium]